MPNSTFSRRLRSFVVREKVLLHTRARARRSPIPGAGRKTEKELLKAAPIPPREKTTKELNRVGHGFISTELSNQAQLNPTYGLLLTDHLHKQSMAR